MVLRRISDSLVEGGVGLAGLGLVGVVACQSYSVGQQHEAVEARCLVGILGQLLVEVGHLVGAALVEQRQHGAHLHIGVELRVGVARAGILLVPALALAFVAWSDVAEDFDVVERIGELRCADLSGLELDAGAALDETAEQAIVCLCLAEDPRWIGHTGLEQRAEAHVDERDLAAIYPEVDIETELTFQHGI